MSEFSPFPPDDGPTCPVCDTPLTDRGGPAMRTQMAGPQPGYDDNGQYHSHDPNWNKTTYECENGHRVCRATRRRCPAPDCDYGGETEMTVLND